MNKNNQDTSFCHLIGSGKIDDNTGDDIHMHLSIETLSMPEGHFWLIVEDPSSQYHIDNPERMNKDFWYRNPDENIDDYVIGSFTVDDSDEKSPKILITIIDPFLSPFPILFTMTPSKNQAEVQLDEHDSKMPVAHFKHWNVWWNSQMS